jgi:hypothetical protein
MPFYTYLWLREDGTPWYAGKGTKGRAFRKGCPGKERIFVQDFPDEVSAFAAEIFLIEYYGRIDLGTGCLRNRTGGGEGTKNISEDLRKQRSIVASQRNSLYGNPRTAVGCVKGGQIAGRKNVESGHWAKLHTRENCAKGGRIGGKTPGRNHSEMGRKGGAISGRRAAENGRIQQQAANGGHTRWHVNRGIMPPTCALCSHSVNGALLVVVH